MRVVHDGRVLASTVEVADSTLGRARGLMFRRSIPDDFALVFRFDRVARRDVHMVFVPFPIDVLWLRGETVARATRLRPWIGLGVARADTIVELPAGVAADVDAGETVRIEPGDG